MFTRRLLRIKVMQALYAFFQTKNDSIAKGEKELFFSIKKIYELYIYQLSLLVEIFEFAKKNIAEGRNKYYPSAEEMHPNTRFVNNSIVEKIANHPLFLKEIETLKINWLEEQDLIKKIYINLKASEEFKNHLETNNSDFNADKHIILYLYKEYILQALPLLQIIEEKSIYWSDNFEYVAQLIEKNIQGLKPNSTLNSLFINKTNKSAYEELLSPEEREFIQELYHKTILNKNKYEQWISEKLQNWEFERISFIDMLLMEMALCELIRFNSIPVKVSLNEYIEIAKIYSSPRSNVFINGILDKLITELTEQKIIQKTGRGLIE